MIGYDHDYHYPVQVEVITSTGRSYISGYRDRATAIRRAKENVQDRHAGTTLSGLDCTVLIHTEYATWPVHRGRGHTDTMLRRSS